MELELWLNRQINPKIGFKFYEVFFPAADGNNIRVTLIEIPCAEGEPTKYESVGYDQVLYDRGCSEIRIHRFVCLSQFRAELVGGYFGHYWLAGG